MRIALLHWAFPPLIGGVETHLSVLGPELVRQGHQVYLLTGAVDGEETVSTWEGMQIRRTPLMDLNTLDDREIRRLAPQVRAEILTFITTTAPDVIHAHNMHYFSPVHVAALVEAKERVGAALVLTAHNVWDDDMWEEMNTMAGVWDMVIAVSHYIKKELVLAGYRPERVRTIHHGIDHHQFAPPGSEDLAAIYNDFPMLRGRRVIFHPARMSFGKGCHISVKAFDIIHRQFPETMLVMCGTEKIVDWGHEQQRHVRKIQQMITTLGLQDHVFVKFFSTAELRRVYQAAEICLYPSCFEEPFGLVMLEAMASGKPIVVSHAGGMPEVVNDGFNGYVVPMFDHAELADRCLDLLRYPAMARELGERGRKVVEERYTKELMTAKTIAVYENALAMVREKADSPAETYRPEGIYHPDELPSAGAFYAHPSQEH